jgi:hypothetical protein
MLSDERSRPDAKANSDENQSAKSLLNMANLYLKNNSLEKAKDFAQR